MKDETLDDYLERKNLFLCRELTDEEIEEIFTDVYGYDASNLNMNFAKAILRKAQEK